MRKALFFAPLLALAVVTAACAAGAGAAPSRPPPPPLQDGSATINLGGHARFGHVDLAPVRIEEDSRCPIGVQCVWAGTVRVAVYIEDNGEVLVHPVVMTLGEPLGIQDGGSVTLVSVCPYPRHPDKIPTDAYRFTFTLRLRAPPPPVESACGP